MAVSRLFPDLLDTDSVDLVRTEPKFTDLPKFVLGQDDTIPTGAMRGSATHIFMQFCDFENAEKNGVEAELARLCDKGFIDNKLAELVYIDRLRAFFRSPLYVEIKNAKNVWREKRFSIMLPAAQFTKEKERKDALSESKLLVQGVFDCLFEKADGTLKLIDYKTDSVSGDQKADEAMFVERYTTQLSYYKIACEKMMRRNISEISVYSFALGREISIPVWV
jgi:ATP-dependent helicase/nuclease subunit A